MKIYFMSAQPCALTLNGVFYGITDSFERSAEISLSDRVYAKFSPEGSLAIGCFITESLRFTPPEGCDVYLLPDGIAIYAHDFPPIDYTLHPIAQCKENNLLATVFQQGKPQLTVESSDGFFNTTLPPSFKKCEITISNGLILLHHDHALAVFTTHCDCLLHEQILSFHIDGNVLSATLPLSDSMQRVADCQWNLSPDAITQSKFTLRQAVAKNKTNHTTNDALLAYAFFESILLKADYTLFLSEELQENASQIVAFLGNFISVILTDTPNVCGLVKKKAERLFCVDYYTVIIKNGKIIDVKG